MCDIQPMRVPLEMPTYTTIMVTLPTGDVAKVEISAKSAAIGDIFLRHINSMVLRDAPGPYVARCICSACVSIPVQKPETPSADEYIAGMMRPRCAADYGKVVTGKLDDLGDVAELFDADGRKMVIGPRSKEFIAAYGFRASREFRAAVPTVVLNTGIASADAWQAARRRPCGCPNCVASRAHPGPDGRAGFPPPEGDTL